MSPTIIILTGNCALYIIYMYVEVRHGIYMCSKIWKIENMHRPNSLALQAEKKTVSLQFFAWICEKNCNPAVTICDKNLGITQENIG